MLSLLLYHNYLNHIVLVLVGSGSMSPAVSLRMDLLTWSSRKQWHNRDANHWQHSLRGCPTKGCSLNDTEGLWAASDSSVCHGWYNGEFSVAVPSGNDSLSHQNQNCASRSRYRGWCHCFSIDSSERGAPFTNIFEGLQTQHQQLAYFQRHFGLEVSSWDWKAYLWKFCSGLYSLVCISCWSVA